MMRAIPYGLHEIDDDDVLAVRGALAAAAIRNPQIEQDDIEAVIDALRSPLLTQGPNVAKFESKFAGTVNARYAVACSSGTAALHLALKALDVGPGDICVVPAITFVATATAVRFCGAHVQFADVDPLSGLMTPESLNDAIRKAPGPVKVAIPVHLGGRMCDMAGLAAEARHHNVILVEDACHALGTIGSDGSIAGECRFSEATVFSFHPVKTIACGEGGMVTTNTAAVAERVSRLRNHGITRDPDLMSDRTLSFDQEGLPNPWSYEQLEIGFNYRMNEMEAALGLSQLSKLDRFVKSRSATIDLYRSLLSPFSQFISVPNFPGDAATSFHILAVRLEDLRLRAQKSELMRHLVSRGVGCQVHYIPVYRQPYFVDLYGEIRLPGSEKYYQSTMTIPLYPAMLDSDVRGVALELAAAIARFTAPEA